MRPLQFGKAARKRVCTRIGVDEPDINVYDVETKKVVFTGTRYQVATFLSAPIQTINSALQKKFVTQKKYALRIKKEAK